MSPGTLSACPATCLWENILDDKCECYLAHSRRQARTLEKLALPLFHVNTFDYQPQGKQQLRDPSRRRRNGGDRRGEGREQKIRLVGAHGSMVHTIRLLRAVALLLNMQLTRVYAVQPHP